MPGPARIAVLLAVMAATIAVVAGVGTALTPRYGDLEPYGTTPVADLRTRPTTEGWSVNLARAVMPGVPVRCVGFQSSDSTGRYVVVTGTTPSLGSSSRCSQASVDQIDSTVALLDTDTGRVLWSKNLQGSFPSRSGAVLLEYESVVPDAHSVLVQLSVDGVSTYAALSMTSGDVLSSTALDPESTGGLPTVSGGLVLIGGSVARSGATQYELAQVDRIGEPVWTAVLDDDHAPILTDTAAFASIDGRSSRIDADTGRITQLGNGSVDLTSTISDSGELFTSDTLRSGVVVTAYDDSGRALWTRSGIGDLSGLTRDCLMTSLPGTSRGSCVDRATGRVRWSTDIATGSFAYSVPGQTTNQIMVYRNKGDVTELDFFDGATGRLQYPIELPPVSFTILAARTTGYLQVSSDSGTPTGITAFDTRTGKQLWTLPEAGTRDTSFWGGQLVRLSKNGVATQLVDRPRTVLGE
ncbi:putative pyrroloquinoline-quinone binding quinoprotein [Frondihabitans australicus]|uniref:Putative pyrroloquinoline-quinone binding quinoprotein n=2 Tax=Frondihabitans australicus TaxID=386892 RepID=A0A495IDC3_9MICO|nr:putative pyrroloquinoline-quinone binding quinoprotein [Frondihabitans australicus]